MAAIHKYGKPWEQSLEICHCLSERWLLSEKRHLFSSCNDDPAENYLLFGCTVSLQHADVLKYQMHNLQQQQNYLKLQFPRIITVITLIINRTGQKIINVSPQSTQFPHGRKGEWTMRPPLFQKTSQWMFSFLLYSNHFEPLKRTFLFILDNSIPF